MNNEDILQPSSSFHEEECEDNAPPNKKIKVISSQNKTEKLEDRLNHILSCSVCLDLPTSACMQCCHGHLMCIGCYHHLLADARLKDEQATCPSCRVDISRGSCIRNLAVEKTISELPVQCSSCSETFPRNRISMHELHDCTDRVVFCRFKQLGCPWSGPAHEMDIHIKSCGHSCKTPAELLQCLDLINMQQKDQVAILHNVVSLLSCEHICYVEVQLRPYRTDDFVTKLFYESNRFHLLGHTWAIKISEPLEVDFMLLRAPYDDVYITAKPSYTKFTSDITESKVHSLEANDVNRMLGAKVINFRLFMFQHKR